MLGQRLRYGPPGSNGDDPDPAEIEGGEAILLQELKTFEKIWLSRRESIDCSSNPIFQQVERHLVAREKAAARELLKAFIEAHPRDASAWQLMSRAVVTRAETIFCLEQVLRIHPDNPELRRAVKRLKASRPQTVHPGRVVPPSPNSLAAPQILLKNDLERQPAADRNFTKQRFLAWKLRRSTLVKNISIWLGALIVGLFILTALAAPLLAPPDPGIEFSTYKYIGPVTQLVPNRPQAGLLLGSVTDPANLRQLDIWYSLVWGTRSALRFGLLVVLFTATFGIILGAVSAYLGGLSSTLIMGFTDAFLSFPVIAGVIFFQQFILLLLRSTGVIVYWNGTWAIPESPSAWQLFLGNLDPLLIAFIVFSWMSYARMMNSEVLRIRQEEYIMAARSLGAGHLRLIFRHLIPNSVSSVIVLAARDVGYMVMMQAGFTFIRLSHSSEWGVLLSLGRNYVIGPGGNPFTWWWVFFPPTLAIVLFGVGWNLLGDGVNNWLNPHQS
jgi:peptide/nickel transport system permease protein